MRGRCHPHTPSNQLDIGVLEVKSGWTLSLLLRFIQSDRAVTPPEAVCKKSQSESLKANRPLVIEVTSFSPNITRSLEFMLSLIIGFSAVGGCLMSLFTQIATKKKKKHVLIKAWWYLIKNIAVVLFAQALRYRPLRLEASHRSAIKVKNNFICST